MNKNNKVYKQVEKEVLTLLKKVTKLGKFPKTQKFKIYLTKRIAQVMFNDILTGEKSTPKDIVKIIKLEINEMFSHYRIVLKKQFMDLINE